MLATSMAPRSSQVAKRPAPVSARHPGHRIAIHNGHELTQSMAAYLVKPPNNQPR
jgi:hypothetical protein